MRARPVAVASGGLTLEAEIVLPDEPRTLVILLHGIPGGPPGSGPDDPTDLGYPGWARRLAEAGHAACWVNMRGVRTSPGDFSISGWIDDASATLDAASALAPGVRPVICGSSAGGYIALRLGAQRPDVAAVATFAAVAHWDDLLSDADATLAYMRNLGLIRDGAFPRDKASWLEGFAEPATASIGKIAPRPVLLVQGDSDTIVPPHHAEALFEAAGEPKELVRISGGGHQLRRDDRALEAFEDWLWRRFRDGQ